MNTEDATPLDANHIAVIFENFAIDHGPTGYPAVQQKLLSEAAVLLREHGQQAAEIERLKAEVEALLRQASELLHRQWTCSAVWSMEEAQDLDAAIKTHLGEV